MELVIGILAVPVSLALVGYIAKISYDKGFRDGWDGCDNESLTLYIDDLYDVDD